MSIQRLRERVPDAVFLTVATLTQHSLRFHKAGSDGSGKCDAYYTGDISNIVWGVLFEMPLEQLPALDQAEGLGFGYDAKQVEVITLVGENYQALTYYATKFNTNLSPYDWYLNHVLVGARETHLPKDYIVEIESITSIVDLDTHRSQREYAIHQW